MQRPQLPKFLNHGQVEIIELNVYMNKFKKSASLIPSRCFAIKPNKREN